MRIIGERRIGDRIIMTENKTHVNPSTINRIWVALRLCGLLLFKLCVTQTTDRVSLYEKSAKKLLHEKFPEFFVASLCHLTLAGWLNERL